MLSSGSSHRLLSLLTQAIHSCKEEERKLEEQLRKYRKLLGDWKTNDSEALNKDESEKEAQESRPSLEEAKEVELLNKALEKALKVRGGLRPESPKTSSSMQTMPAHTTSQEKPVKPLQTLVNPGSKPKTYQLKPPYKTMPGKRSLRGSARLTSTANMVKPPPLRPLTSANNGKDRVPSTASTSRSPPSILLTSEKGNSGKDRPPSTTNASRSPPSIPLTSEKGNSGKDRPPSTTNASRSPPSIPLTSEKGNSGKDRPPSTTNASRSPPSIPLTSEKGNSGKDRPPSTTNASRSPPSIPLTSEKGNSGKDRPPSTTNASRSPPSIPLTSEKGNSGKDRPPLTTNVSRSPPLRPLPSEKSQDRPWESKTMPRRADSTQANFQPSSAPDIEYVSSILTATDVKASKQDQRQQQALTLKDVGPTLNLPVKYQQLYKKNSRLWEKYFELRGRVPAPRPSFIQQLQTTFISGSPELSLLEIEEEMLHLQRAIRRLEEYIDTAKTWQGSGLAHWQHYRTLLMLEAMQDEVAKSHCELQKLRLVAEQYKRWCEKLSINLDCSEVVGCPTEFCALPSVLVYSHPDQLRQLTATHLRVRELQQKIHLQKVLSHELLAEADLQCRSSSPSYLLLRSIYTQLCEGGDTFPVLVHDDS